MASVAAGGAGRHTAACLLAYGAAWVGQGALEKGPPLALAGLRRKRHHGLHDQRTARQRHRAHSFHVWRANNEPPDLSEPELLRDDYRFGLESIRPLGLLYCCLLYPGLPALSQKNFCEGVNSAPSREDYESGPVSLYGGRRRQLPLHG